MQQFETLETYPSDLQVGDRILAWPTSMRVSGRQCGVVRATGPSPDGLAAYVMIYFVNGQSDRAPIDRRCTVKRVVSISGDNLAVITEFALIISGELERLHADGVLDLDPHRVVGGSTSRAVRDASARIATALHTTLSAKVLGSSDSREVAS